MIHYSSAKALLQILGVYTPKSRGNSRKIVKDNTSFDQEEEIQQVIHAATAVERSATTSSKLRSVACS
jgi:hypothetical protein